NIERKLMPVYYAASSVHLLPSDVEGSPNSVKEALACGVPVVARNVGGVGNLLRDVSGCAAVDEVDVERRATEVARSQSVSRNDVRHDFLQKGLDTRSV